MHVILDLTTPYNVMSTHDHGKEVVCLSIGVAGSAIKNIGNPIHIGDPVHIDQPALGTYRQIM